MISRINILIYICVLVAYACKPSEVSNLDHCLSASSEVVENADSDLNRLVKILNVKHARPKVIRLSEIYESKDNIAIQIHKFFDLKGYRHVMNPIDTLIFKYPRTKENIFNEIEIVGSDSLLAALISNDRDTTLYRQVLKLDKLKVKRYLASLISSYDYRFDRVFAVAEQISSDTMQLGLTSTKNAFICDVDSVQLDGKWLTTDDYTLIPTHYYVPYDFYFKPSDNVELEVVLKGAEGQRVFPLKYDGR